MQESWQKKKESLSRKSEKIKEKETSGREPDKK